MSSDGPRANSDLAQAQPFEYCQMASEMPSDTGTNGGASGIGLPYGNLGSGAARREKEAFERGLQEGASRAQQTFQQQITALQASVGNALEGFKSERSEYFARVEPEVVRLALAIARKILHRESQMDPLLLTGLVHVALQKVQAGTQVRLRTHPDDLHFWNQHFSQPGAPQPAPELAGDANVKRGELALETEVGSTQVGLDTQLKEIEQGFFDLLEQRPRIT